MTSQPVRDQITDHLLTPENSAFLIIDYQPTQLNAVRSIDHELLMKNIVSSTKLAKLFDLPVVHSTVNVANGQEPTLPALAELLSSDPPIDRTTMNAWEDLEFLAAVRATGRRKLVLCALWTEICMTFPALDALREGYEVFAVLDAIGGTSPEAHRAGVERVVKAGAQPTSWVGLAGELQRDWGRTETIPQLVEIVINERLEKD
jgi:nicotinamidase-related amidase